LKANKLKVSSGGFFYVCVIGGGMLQWIGGTSVTSLFQSGFLFLSSFFILFYFLAVWDRTTRMVEVGRNE
jgi:hypothetical protein